MGGGGRSAGAGLTEGGGPVPTGKPSTTTQEAPSRTPSVEGRAPGRAHQEQLSPIAGSSFAFAARCPAGPRIELCHAGVKAA